MSSSEKLIRLRGELSSAFELSKIVLAREAQKREVGIKSRELWERRMVVADLKRQYPQLGAREDEEMLFDKERVPKRPRPSDASYDYSYVYRDVVADIFTFTERHNRNGQTRFALVEMLRRQYLWNLSCVRGREPTGSYTRSRTMLSVKRKGTCIGRTKLT